MSELVRVVCNPVGVDGPVYVPDLGLFAPGEHAVTADAAVILLASPHFAPPDASTDVDEQPAAKRARPAKE